MTNDSSSGGAGLDGFLPIRAVFALHIEIFTEFESTVRPGVNVLDYFQTSFCANYWPSFAGV